MRPILPGSETDAGFRFPMPSPVGGWNARDNIAAMPATDALVLDNWFPGTTSVAIRAGSAANATLNISDTLKVRTLLGVSKMDGTFKRFAVADNGIYDITAGGTISAVASACSSNQCESLQNNVGGVSYLTVVFGDGVNDCKLYNATTNTWQALNGASVPVLTGPTSNKIVYISEFKNREILTEVNSLKFWIGPLDAVGGVFTAFDLGSVFERGGYLMATGNWTVDAGDGIDDRFVAVTSEGEVAIYQGTDPTDATKFSLVGRYDIGKPVGRRCLLNIAGDVGILCEDGVWPLSKALQSATVDKKPMLTDKIQWAFNGYYKQFGTQFGWQFALLPKGPALLVNVPIGFQRSYQFVMNTMTGAWCRFVNWNAECMLVQDGKLYFASNRTIREGWTGLKDLNAAITGTAATAFSYGPAKARGKKINLAQPILQGSAGIEVSLALDTDFNQRRALTTQASFLSNIALWDSAIFDQAIWSGGQVAVNKWKAVKHKPGGAFSLRLRVQVKDIEVSWAATNFIGEAGGIF